MNDYFKNAFSALNEEQKEELALCIGFEKLDIYLEDRSVSPIVMIAWELYTLLENPEMANFN